MEVTMAIRFTPEYNARINKIVKNYNQKVNRANRIGKINRDKLPENVSARQLKKSYTRRKDLERELKNLELFSRKSVRNRLDNVSEYDIKLIKSNKQAAIKYYENLADLIAKKAVSGYPLEKRRYNEIQDNLELLKSDISSASVADLKSIERSIDKYRRSFERQATGYRGFLSEIEAIMDRVGVDSTSKKEFFDKLSQLNQEEFYELYESTDIIRSVYELADSPKYTGGKLVLHDTEKNAKRLIDDLMNDIDYLINKVKSK